MCSSRHEGGQCGPQNIKCFHEQINFFTRYPQPLRIHVQSVLYLEMIITLISYLLIAVSDIYSF